MHAQSAGSSLAAVSPSGDSGVLQSPRTLRIKSHGLVVDMNGRVVSPALLPQCSSGAMSPRSPVHASGPRTLLEALMSSDDEDEYDEDTEPSSIQSEEDRSGNDMSSGSSASTSAAGKRGRSAAPSDDEDMDANAQPEVEDAPSPTTAAAVEQGLRAGRSARLRRRLKVDYQALNQQMFGSVGEGMRADDAVMAAALLDEDDEDFVLPSEKARASKAREGPARSAK